MKEAINAAECFLRKNLLGEKNERKKLPVRFAVFHTHPILSIKGTSIFVHSPFALNSGQWNSVAQSTSTLVQQFKGRLQLVEQNGEI